MAKKNHPNLKEHEWKKGQSGNPKGRPKKSFALINEKLKKSGYEPLRKKELMETYALIFSVTEADLKEIVKDKQQPYALRLIIMGLNDKKVRAKALQDYIEYAFNNDEQPIVNYNVDVSREEAEQILKQAKEEF